MEKECGIEAVNKKGEKGRERETLEMGERRKNSALKESRVVIFASCVCSGGFYVGVFINKMGDDNVIEMKEVGFLRLKMGERRGKTEYERDIVFVAFQRVFSLLNFQMWNA